MSISTDLTRLQSAKAAMKTAIEGKGVAVADGAKLDAFAALIDSISAGGGGAITFATGTHTPTATTALNVAYGIEHDLGYIPDIFFLYACGSGVSHKMFCITARRKYFFDDPTGTVFLSYCAGASATDVYGADIGKYQPTATKVWVRSATANHQLGAGTTYRWFAVGGLT